MGDVLNYRPAPPTAVSQRDLRHLRAVEIGHYVWGGLILVPFGGMFLMSTCLLPFHSMADDPGVSGLDLLLTMAASSAPGVAVGWLTVRSGRLIGRRGRRTFSLRWAGAYAAFGLAAVLWALAYVARSPRWAPGPVVLSGLVASGLILGVPTWRVLSRASVKEVYDAHERTGRAGAPRGRRR